MVHRVRGHAARVSVAHLRPPPCRLRQALQASQEAQHGLTNALTATQNPNGHTRLIFHQGGAHMPAALRAAANLSLKQLYYLVTLRETLNFTRAAERCFVTQSTLSGGLKELESTLGVHLVERDRQTVRFTPLGEAVADLAHRLLSEAHDLIDRCQVEQDPAQGELHLGAIPTIAPFLLPGLLRGLRAEMPQLRVILREEPTHVLLQLVDRGELDLAILALPMDLGRLHSEHLFSEELWLVASSADAYAKLKEPRLSKLDTHRLLLLSEGHCLSEHTLQACERAQRGRNLPVSEIEATSVATLVQMVEAGLGVALLPEMAIQSRLLQGSDVIARPLATPAPKRDIALVRRPTQTPNVVTDTVLRLAKAMRPHQPTGAKRSQVSRATKSAPPTATGSSPAH